MSKKIEFYIGSPRNGTFYFTSIHDLEDFISEEDWNELTEEQQDEKLNKIGKEILLNYVEYGAELIEE